jgi:cytochrome c biogenesis factor
VWLFPDDDGSNWIPIVAFLVAFILGPIVLGLVLRYRDRRVTDPSMLTSRFWRDLAILHLTFMATEAVALFVIPTPTGTILATAILVAWLAAQRWFRRRQSDR